MLTLSSLLIVLALLLTIASVGRSPLWVPVFLVTIVLALERWRP